MNNKLLQFVESIEGWLSINEGKYLESAVTKTSHLPGVVVEIGSFCGKSTIWLAQKNSKVYAVDPHLGEISPEEKMHRPPSYKIFIHNLKTARVLSKVHPIVKTSEKAAVTWKKKIRVLFIDALHDEQNASNDFRLWTAHLVDGGIIAIHDSFRRWCGSEKVAVKKIVLSPDYYKIGYVDSIIYGVKGKGTKIDACKKMYSAGVILTYIHAYHVYVLFHIIKSSFINILKFS